MSLPEKSIGARLRNVHVLALGSPHGDDQAGWEVARRLGADPLLAPRLHLLQSPWDIVEHLETDCSVIVLDACRGVASGGRVVTISEAELPRSAPGWRSTHGGSPAGAFELARQLNRCPREVVVFAIMVEACDPAIPLSQTAMMAVEEAVQKVRALLVEWKIATPADDAIVASST